MYLGTYGIDEYVAIPAVTHRFSSGAAYAPTAITYSIYEEGNTTGLDENIDMTPASPFDSVTGLYYARRQLTAAAGFEANKTYVVVVKATVDSVSALDVHVFQVRPLQTGDSYAIVNHADYGNAKLVRSTTPANTLTVDANHLVAVPATQKVDVDTIKTQTVTCAAGVTVRADVGTATQSTAQTGDSYAIVNGDHGLVSIQDDVDAIKLQTDKLTFEAVTNHIEAAVQNIAADAIDAAAIKDAAIDANTFAANALDAVWSTTARTLTAGTNLGGLEVDLTKIHGTALTETAGQLAAAFTKMFDVATPVLTCESVNQAQDNATTAEIVTAMEANGSKLDHLWEMTEDDGGVRRLTTNALEQAPSGGLDAAGVAAAVWDAVASNYDDAGSMGALLNDAGAAGDPWATALPGGYGVGTAGKAIADILADTGTDGVLLTTGAIMATAFGTGAITNAAVADDVDVNVKSIANGAITAGTIADNAIDLATFAADAKTGSAIKANIETVTAGAINAAALHADMDAELATIIWNAAVAAYGTAGTYGAAVEDILADTNELQVDDYPTSIAAVKTVADAVKLKTDNIPSTPAAVGSAMTISSGAITAGVFAAGAITADVIANAAIDQATFAADVYVTCDVKKVNGTTLTGDGGATPWGPA